MLSIATSMVELASSMPTSGGLYYASAVLAGPRFGPFAAWWTGWIKWFCQVGGAPSVDYGCAAMILAAASSIMNPPFVPETWHTCLLAILLMLLRATISSMPALWLASFNSIGTTITIISATVLVREDTGSRLNSNSFA